jgi:uncharacterized protein involved in outer membrane biogenesis
VATAANFRLRLLGSVHVQAPLLQIGAPAWSQAPYLLRAEGASVELLWGDLWRAWQGEPLRIHRLAAATIDGEFERLADGRASWQFERTAEAAAGPAAFRGPTFGRVRLDQGELRFRDELLGLTLRAVISLNDGEPAPAGLQAQGSTNLFRIRASGRWREWPLKAELTSAGVLPWVTDESPPALVPLVARASVGRSSLEFKGHAVDALHLNGLDGRFVVKGPSLAEFGAPLGVTLPTTRAFRTEGELKREGPLWRVLVSAATVGASRLDGDFRYDTGRRVHLLSGRLGGPRLLLSDLGPAIGVAPASAKPRKGGKILPNRPFDLATLRLMDAEVALAIEEVDLDTNKLEPLRPLRGRLALEAGVLTIDEIDTHTAQGRLQGRVSLDGRGDIALWSTDLRWSDVRLDRWVRQPTKPGAPPWVSGRLGGRATLQGRGLSTAAILASLQGQVRSELRDGRISHLAVEAAGLDIAQALGIILIGDQALKVNCAAADLEVAAGIVKPKVLVLDSDDSTMWVEGSLSFASESLDLRLMVAPHDFSLVSLRTPLRLRGSFAQPKVSVSRGAIAGKAAAAVVLGLINPVAALIPLLDPGDSEAAGRSAAGCQALAQRGRAASARHAAGK